MTDRSNRAEVRNPILIMPATKALASLDRASLDMLAAILWDIRTEAKARAQQCWLKSKPPMAAYWAASAVWAGHIAKVLRRLSKDAKPTRSEKLEHRAKEQLIQRLAETDCGCLPKTDEPCLPCQARSLLGNERVLDLCAHVRHVPTAHTTIHPH